MFGTLKTLFLPEDTTGSISTDKTFALTSGTMAEEELKKLEKDVSRDWKEGDLIMGLYEVLKILGEGSFGKVYRVRHRIWNRDLAVKSLHWELAGKESQREAFVKECEGWVNLGLHPNVVTAYYVRSLGGLPGIFLEYIEGGDLAERIKKGALKGWEEILDLSIQCLEGLSFAHSKGLVHRDIKPLNCLLTAGGELKITDFGIAEGLSKLDITSKEDLSGKTVVTEGGSAGTPAYMPPEQWSSQHGPVGQWSDIYAFGIMLYEMCCRRRPFGEDGASLMVLKAHHLTVEPPHPSEFNRDIPGVLSEFILKCLKKKPEERFQTGKEARKELAGIYKTVTGKDYPGKITEEIELRADSLNNRAVSLIDLGKSREALKIWEEALRIEKHHAESVYNSSLVLWRSGRKGDHDALSLLEEAGKSGKDRGKIDYFLSLIHLERGDYGKALGLLEGIEGEITEETLMYRDLAKKLSPSAPGCLNTLQGHTKEIVSLSISEDGRFLLSGGRDNTVRLWDLSSGRMIRTFTGHSKWVIGVSIDSEGKKGLSGSLDDTLRLWDLTTGQCIRIFDERVQVNCLSLSKDGLIAVSGQEYGTVKVWDTGRGKCLKTLEGHTGRIQSVSISSDGKRALSGSDDLTIKVWDLEKETCLKTLEGHEDKINSVFLSPDGKMAISGSKDKTIRIWDTGTGRCIKILHTFFVNSVALSPDGKWALSGDDNCAVKLWEVTSGRCIRTFEGHKEFVLSVLFGKDLKTAVSASYDRTIKVWDISLYVENKLLFYSPLVLCRVKRTEESAGAQAEFSRLMEEGKKAFSKGKYKDVLNLMAKARAIEGYERDMEALELLNRAGSYMKRTGLKGAWEEKSLNASASVSSISLSLDGKKIISGGSHKDLRVWNLPDGNSEILEGHTEEAHYIAMTQDGELAFSHGNDGTLRLWDISSKKCIKSIQITNILSIAISSDGKWGVAGGDRTIKLFALSSGRAIRTFAGHTGFVQALAVSTDGTRILSGSNDNKERLRLWEISSGKCLKSFDTFYVNALALSFCGNYGLAGSSEAMDKSEKTLTLWDINSGKCIQDFGSFREEVRSVALSLDGKWAVTGGKDYKVRIWEISSGKCLRVLEGHKDIVTSVAISGDCRWILSGSRDRTIKLWQLDLDFTYCEPQSWNQGGEPYIKNFLLCHTPYCGTLPAGREPSGEEINKALTRKGNPVWTDEDFEKLLVILRYGGYGWIRTEVVKEKLGKPLLPDRVSGEVSSVVSNKFPGRYFVKKAFFDAKNLYLMENITKSFVTSVSISEYGGKLLVGSFDNLPLCLDLSTGRADVKLEGTTSSLGFAVLNKDGKLALSRTSDRILSLWDMTRGKIIRTFEGHTFDVNSFDISPDNRFVISCSGDKTIRLWDLNTGRVIRTITGHGDNVTAVAFSPDGRYVVSGGFDKTINLWDLATGKCIKVFRGHSFYIRSLSWSGDMKKILSGSEDKTLKLWDVSTGNCIRTFEGHSGSVISVSMTQDGKWAVSGSRDKTVKLWNTETGECIRTFEEHSALIQGVVISKDGSLLVSGGSDNKVIVRELLWQFEEVSPGNWTEDARPYINSFLYIHTGKDCRLPDDREPSEEEINKAFSRQGLPVWTEWDEERFLEMLKYAGFGWIRPEEVKKELEKALPRPIEINDITLPLSTEKADVNKRDGEWKTPLIKAIEIHDITLPLSREKEDINKRDGEWKTPLIRAVEKDDLSEVKNLLEKGADLSLGDRFGITPLHRASIKNRSDIAQLLLEKGVKTDIEDIDGRSPLHWVKGAETAELLIKKGADVNKRDKRKQTPLITAAMDGSVEVIKTLVKHGGDINGKDETNYAPLHWTVVSKQMEAAKVLLSLGADINIKDNFNRTPLELAESHGAKEMASIIKDFASKKPAADPAPSPVKPPAEEKAKVCDVCSKPLSGKEGTLYKAGDFRNMVSKGFEPAESFIGMMTKLGLKRDVIIKQWQEQTVFPSPSDWLLCGECAGRAKKIDVTVPSATSPGITVPCDLKNVNHLRIIGGVFTLDMLIGGIPLQKLFDPNNLKTQLHRLVSDSSGDKEALHTLLSTFPSHIDTIYSVALSPDGKKILSGGIDTTVKLWDSDTGMLLKTLGGHTFNVYSIVFSNDGRLALSAGGDKLVKVWDMVTGRCIKTLSHSDQVHSVALSSDGKTALSGSFDKTLKVWDISSGTCLKTLEGHTNRVYSVAISGDGTVALSGSNDNTVRLWDIPSGKCLKVFKDHSDNVECVAISPDGTTGASGGRDCTIRLWNLKKQKCIKVLKGHTSTVRTLFIDSYGKWLISGCSSDTELPGHGRDKTIRFWNIAGGKCVKTIEGNSQRVYSAVMSRDGRRLASGGMDSSINVWNLEWEYKEESQDTWVSKIFGFFGRK